MNTLLNAAYGLDELGFGSPDARFGWATALSSWGWVLGILGALGLSLLAYARVAVSTRVRLACVLLRTTLLLSLIALALGPRLERPRTRVEQDRVLYLVDRSASMSVDDGAGITRDDRLRELIAENVDLFGTIAEQKTARWYSFGSVLTPLRAWDSGVPLLADSDEPGTRLDAALAGTLRDNTGHPVSAVVVFSDGRSTESQSGTGRRDEAGTEGSLSLFRQASVPIIVVPFGSDSQAPDVAVASVDAPGVAFVDDTVPVRVELNASAPTESGSGRVEIIDAATGVLLEEKQVSAEDLERGEVTIPVRFDQSGEPDWTVRYVPEGPDLSDANNSASLSVRFVDDPIRVLYLDGSPRWERRYLKNLLLREESIDSSSLILAADRRFQQEGDTILSTLPVDDAEWDAFDLIILGDFRSELLGERAAAIIKEQVGERGTGLLWLAGPSATPQSWSGSLLGDLLPVRTSSERTAEVWRDAVVIGPTPLSERLGLFRDLFGSTRVSDPESGWSRLRWAIRLDASQLKSSAESIASAIPIGGTSEPSSLAVSMRYGAGRSVLVATDEIWRWRYGRGESATEQFWLPIIRHLARPRLTSLGSGVTLTPSSSIITTGQRVVVELVISDRSLAEISPPTIHAVARPDDAKSPPLPLRLSRDQRGGDSLVRYRGAFTPLRPGAYTVSLRDQASLGVSPETTVSVVNRNDELLSPQTDHDSLRRLAEATSGRVLEAEAFAELADVLPNRRVIIPLAPEVRTLWDHWIPLVWVILIAGSEWIIRRRSRLP